MFINTWGEVFTTSLQSLWMGVISFAPNLIIAIIVFIIGWMVGSLVGKAIAQVVSALKIDKLFESAGAGEMMQRMGMKLNVGSILGGLVKWIIIVVFLMMRRFCFNPLVKFIHCILAEMASYRTSI